MCTLTVSGVRDGRFVFEEILDASAAAPATQP
jgi:hypothetical protein